MGGRSLLQSLTCLLALVAFAVCNVDNIPPLLFPTGSIPSSVPSLKSTLTRTGSSVHVTADGGDESTTVGPTGLFVVQLDGKVTSAKKERLTAAVGYALGPFIPPAAFLLVAPESKAVLAEDLDFVLRVARLPSHLKMDRKVLSTSGAHQTTSELRGSAEAASRSSQADEGKAAGNMYKVFALVLAECAVETDNNDMCTTTASGGLERLAEEWNRVMSRLSERSRHDHYLAEAVSDVKIAVVLSSDNAAFLLACLDVMASEPSVYWLEKQPHNKVFNHYGRWLTKSGTSSVTNVFGSNGLDGENEVVGIGDTGIDKNSCFFHDAEHEVPFDRVSDQHRKIVSYVTTFGDDGDYEGGHGTHVSGTAAGNAMGPDAAAGTKFDGMATKVKIHFTDICAGSVDNINTPADLHKQYFPAAYAAGARVHSNSWGGGGNHYQSPSMEVDKFMHEHPDFLVVVAAGNDGRCGRQTLGSPATAKNALTVGAAASTAKSATAECGTKTTSATLLTCNQRFEEHPQPNQDNLADFSSRGPTPDGRIKPDIAATGNPVWSAHSHGQANDDQTCAVVPYSGTSMATPTTSGNAILVRQYFKHGFYPTGERVAHDALEPSAALVKAVMVNSGESIPFMALDKVWGATTAIPSIDQGFGHTRLLHNLKFASHPIQPRLFVKQDTALASGEHATFCFKVVGAAHDKTPSFKVTIVWTDPASSTLALRNLVNNLDLVVEAPGGVVMLGNAAGQWAEMHGNVADWVNNVEQVTVTDSEAGLYSVHVHGTDVPLGDKDGRQAFAIVVSGDVELVDECAKPKCINDCNGGTCHADGATCTCPNGFTGVDCSAQMCLNGCSGHGVCAAGSCACENGWVGVDCALGLDTLDLEQTHRATVASVGGVHYFKHTVDPSAWRPGMYLQVSVEQTHSSVTGDMELSLNMRSGVLPDLAQSVKHGFSAMNITSSDIRPSETYFISLQSLGDALPGCADPLEVTVRYLYPAELKCPKDCSGHGTCVVTTQGPKCVCERLWSGHDCAVNTQCSTDALPAPCRGLGVVPFSHVRMSTFSSSLLSRYWGVSRSAVYAGFDKMSAKCQLNARRHFCLSHVDKCADDASTSYALCSTDCVQMLTGCVSEDTVEYMCGLLETDPARCYSPSSPPAAAPPASASSRLSAAVGGAAFRLRSLVSSMFRQ